MKTDDDNDKGKHRMNDTNSQSTVYATKLNVYVRLFSCLAADDDDDVIMVPQEEPVITEIPDDDDDEEIDNGDKTNGNAPESNGALAAVADMSNPSSPSVAKKPLEEEITGGVYTNVANESDIQILEPAISVMDLDQIEDEPENSMGIDETSQLSLPIKIKSEPKYEGYADEDEDDAFEVVGTFDESAMNAIAQMDEASGK